MLSTKRQIELDQGNIGYRTSSNDKPKHTKFNNEGESIKPQATNGSSVHIHFEEIDQGPKEGITKNQTNERENQYSRKAQWRANKRVKQQAASMESERVEVIENQTQTQTGNHQNPIVREQISDTECPTKTLCLWGRKENYVAPVKADLLRCCGQWLRDDDLYGMRCIKQSDGKVRFEADIPKEAFTETLKAIQEQDELYGWYCKAKRAHIPVQSTTSPAENYDRAARPMIIATYNINGDMKPKLGFIESFAIENNLSVILMQETNNTKSNLPLYIPGFECWEERAESAKERGARGLATFISDSLNSHPVAAESPYCAFHRITGSNMAQQGCVGNVYMPHDKAKEYTKVEIESWTQQRRDDYKLNYKSLKTQAWLHLKTAVGKLTKQYPNDFIVVGGDTNRTTVQLRRWLNKHLPNMTLVELPEGASKQTCFKQNCRRREGAGDIDHFIITKKDRPWIMHPRVDHSMDQSDHKPVLVNLHLMRQVERKEPEEKMKWTDLIYQQSGYSHDSMCRSFQNHKKWVELNDKTIEDANLAKETEDTINKIADLTCRTHMVIVTKKPGVPTKIRRAQEKQKSLYGLWQSLIEDYEGDENTSKAKEKYETAKKHCRGITRKHTREAWSRKVRLAFNQRRTAPKRFWNWASSTAGWNQKAKRGALQPMQGLGGSLLTEPGPILESWTEHFGNLAKDVTGHSRDPVYWQGGYAAILGQPRQRFNMSKMDEPITLDELSKAVKETKWYKATGHDKIPMEIYKIIMHMDKNDDVSGNVAPGKIALLRVLNKQFNGTPIPESWMTSILVAIFKKEDPTKHGNYRGISLMSTILKILLTIINVRLSSELERVGYFSKAQAGFRSREESVAQAIALYELLQRRKLNNERTYAMFLDFKKAYDVVPHEAVFEKLRALGLDPMGRMYKFTTMLYASSGVQVRGHENSLGTIFRLLRGLRQGCPLSPLLFNIFINDIFEGLEPEEICGVAVPGVEDRINGLLFADDTVVLADNVMILEGMWDGIKRWADYHEMEFGISKCEIIVFIKWSECNLVNRMSTDGRTKTITAQLPRSIKQNKYQTIVDSEFTGSSLEIEGRAMKVVESYTYLGLNFYFDLDLDKMAKDRAQLGEKALFAMEGFLRCMSISPVQKKYVLQSVIGSTATYGAELWSFNARRSMHCQNIMNKGMEMIMGTRNMPRECLWKECGIISMRATCNKARVRAYYKYGSLKTWMGDLMSTKTKMYVDKGHQQTWVTGTESYLNRLRKDVEGMEGVGTSCTEPNSRTQTGVNPSIVAQKVCEAIALKDTMINTRVNRGEIISESVAFRYIQCQYVNMYEDGVYAWIPFYGPGLIMISQFRGQAFYTARKAWTISIGKTLVDGRIQVPASYETRCPFCRTKTRCETESHIITRCVAWEELRTKHLAKLLPKCREIYRRWNTAPNVVRNYTESQAVTILLLGGSIRSDCDGDDSIYESGIADNGVYHELPNWRAYTCKKTNGVPNVFKGVDPEAKIMGGNRYDQAELEDMEDGKGGEAEHQNCPQLCVAAFLYNMRVARREQAAIKAPCLVFADANMEVTIENSDDQFD